MNSNRHARRSAARNGMSARKAVREIPRSRILVIVLALVALTIQMLAVQSHVHPPQAAGQHFSDSSIAPLADAGVDHSSRAQQHKYPDNPDPAKCPFCQQLGHSGQLAVSTVVLITFHCCITVVFVAFSESARALSAVRHSWQSRAPPQE